MDASSLEAWSSGLAASAESIARSIVTVEAARDRVAMNITSTMFSYTQCVGQYSSALAACGAEFKGTIRRLQRHHCLWLTKQSDELDAAEKSFLWFVRLCELSCGVPVELVLEAAPLVAGLLSCDPLPRLSYVVFPAPYDDMLTVRHAIACSSVIPSGVPIPSLCTLTGSGLLWAQPGPVVGDGTSLANHHNIITLTLVNGCGELMTGAALEDLSVRVCVEGGGEGYVVDAAVVGGTLRFVYGIPVGISSGRLNIGIRFLDEPELLREASMPVSTYNACTCVLLSESLPLCAVHYCPDWWHHSRRIPWGAPNLLVRSQC